MKPGKTSKTILYLIYLGLVSVILLEVAVRLWGYSNHYIYDPIYTPFPSCQDIPYVHKPCLEHARARGLAVINTDSLGLRSDEACARYGQKNEQEIRIAVAGDSVTFGEGVPETSGTYCFQLEKILAKCLERQVTVFNFGVSAYSVREMAATAACRMPEVQPDIMIMAVIPEDFNLGRTGTVDRWGYTVHASSDIAEKDSKIKKVLRSIHLTYLIRDVYYSLSNKNETDKQEEVPESYEYLKKFRKAAITHNAIPVVALLPSLGHSFSDEFKERLHRDNVLFIDLSDIVSQFSKRDYMASAFDPHPSPPVHRVIAERIADYLLSHNIVPQK